MLLCAMNDRMQFYAYPSYFTPRKMCHVNDKVIFKPVKRIYSRCRFTWSEYPIFCTLIIKIIIDKRAWSFKIFICKYFLLTFAYFYFWMKKSSKTVERFIYSLSHLYCIKISKLNCFHKISRLLTIDFVYRINSSLFLTLNELVM